MAQNRNGPRSLLARALDTVPAAIRELADALGHIEVSPAIPPQVERHPGGRRRDGLDDFCPGPSRGILHYIPGQDARLILPEDGELRRRLRDAQQRVVMWLEVLKAAEEEASSSIGSRLARAREDLAAWVDPDRGDTSPALSSSPEANAREVRQLADEVARLLEECRAASPSGCIVRVIDTSALMDCPFPRMYGEGGFDFVIPRTVLSELDELRHHDRKSKREQARRALTQVREWERRGDPIEGVIESYNIRIRFLGLEPDMSGAPPDLDRAKADDRILWTARDLTFRSPATTVVLVSGDSNLRARARLEHVETEPATVAVRLD
jgi:hypothetical protein